MFETIAAAEELITAECEKPFEYVAKTYGSYSSGRQYGRYGYGYGYGYDDYDYDPYGGGYVRNQYGKRNNKSDDLPTKASKDIDLELVVTIIGNSGEQEYLIASGNTKAECWLDLFTSYPSICFDDIVDYEFT